jgi:hypothetical protein
MNVHDFFRLLSLVATFGMALVEVLIFISSLLKGK